MDANQSFKLDGVKFDGVGENSAGEAVLLDAKSGMENFIDGEGGFKAFFSKQGKILDQARSQLDAANGTPIQWHFENKDVMNSFKNLLERNDIQGIDLIHSPRQ